MGKSELVYYWSKRSARQQVVAFQVDRMRAGRVVEGLGEYLVASEERMKKIILSELKKMVLERIGLLDIAYTIYEIVKAMKREAILFLDEFHMLPRYEAPRYHGRYEEALTDLEALAHWLAKDSEGYLRVLLTVSKGFIATGEALSRLHGYSTDFMLVEHMDEQHFQALYNEYKATKGRKTSYYTIYGIVGGAPGYLAELCQGEHAVTRFIERSKTVLEESLSSVRNILATGP